MFCEIDRPGTALPSPSHCRAYDSSMRSRSPTATPVEIRLKSVGSARVWKTVKPTWSRLP
jgi:hypothetical protein